MLRSIGAVVAGYISIGVLVVLTDTVLARLYPNDYVQGKAPPDSLLVVTMITATCYSVLGGRLTARLAARKPWGHVIGLIVLGEIMGVVSMVMFWTQQPHWYPLALLVLFPPAVWLGGRLRLGKAA